MLIDSGADLTVVSSNHVIPDDMTGSYIKQGGLHNTSQIYPQAKILLTVGKHSDHYEVAVSETLDIDSLLGLVLELLLHY